MFTSTFMFTHDKPLYEQLYEFMVKEIMNGSLKNGEKVPSKRALASHLKVSQNTVETAYELLVAEGYLRAVARSGFYVCTPDQSSWPIKNDVVFPESEEETRTDALDYRYNFGTNIVDTNFFPYSTWTRIVKDITSYNRDLLNHGHPQGDLCLREAITKYLHEFRGMVCSPDQIVIGAGVEYLIGLIVQILGKSVTVGFENPGYYKSYNIISNNDVKIDLIGLDENGMKVDLLERSEANVAYITPSHQFPTGVIMPIGRRIQLLNWANGSDDRYIIEDDYDSEFRFNGRPIPALEGLDLNDKVIYLSTFSKSIAPSIRIAYTVLPRRLLSVYKKNFSFYSSTVSRFEQHCLYKFIQDGHFSRHLNRMKNIYRSRKDRLVECLKGSKGADMITIIGENTGLHLMTRVENGMKEEELVRSAGNVGVKLYGLSRYYIEDNGDIPEATVILGYSGFELEEISDAVKALERAWFV